MGWGEVKFGMTRKQVVAALDGKAHLEPLRNTPAKLPPLMRTPNTPDLPEALLKARRIVEEAQVKKEADTPKAEAAKRLLKLIKPRVWRKFREGDESASGARKKVLVLDGQLSGTLEDLGDSRGGRFGGVAGGVDTVSIRPQNKRLPAVICSISNLDRDSVKYIAEVTSVIDELSEFLAADLPAEVQREEDMKLVIAPTEIRGIKLMPSIKFDAAGVASVSLETLGADNPTTPVNPRRFAMHQAICEAIEEKYGPPDERNHVADREQVIWRFPKTIIVCSCHRFGIGVTYIMPSAWDSDGADTL